MGRDGSYGDGGPLLAFIGRGHDSGQSGYTEQNLLVQNRTRTEKFGKLRTERKNFENLDRARLEETKS